jgi:hypothetical protein
MHYVRNKIMICGSKKDVMYAAAILEKCPGLGVSREREARQCIQILIDAYGLKATILWDGNTVWGKKRIINDLGQVLQHGMAALSDYLYEFFHLCCGSIAHYDKQGWISQYPDIPSLKQFLMCNEIGQDALFYQPNWAADRIEIIQEMYKVLNIRSMQ